MLKSPTHVWPNRCCSRAGNSPAAVRRKRRTAAKSKNRNNNRESADPLGGRAPDRRCNPNPTSVQKELIRNCPQPDRTRFDGSTKLPFAQHDSLSGHSAIATSQFLCSLTGRLPEQIFAQKIVIVEIFVTKGQTVDALPQHALQRMLNLVGIPPIGQSLSQRFG